MSGGFKQLEYAISASPLDGIAESTMNLINDVIVNTKLSVYNKQIVRIKGIAGRRVLDAQGNCERIINHFEILSGGHLTLESLKLVNGYGFSQLTLVYSSVRNGMYAY